MHGAALGLFPPGVERVAHARAARLDGEIDDGGGAAEGRGARAGFEIVARSGAAEGHVEMGVDVDAAGHHVACRWRRSPDRPSHVGIDGAISGIRSPSIRMSAVRVSRRGDHACRCGSECSCIVASDADALLPGFKRQARFDALHGDAILHRADQPAQIAAHAFVFIHARNARRRRVRRSSRADPAWGSE